MIPSFKAHYIQTVRHEQSTYSIATPQVSNVEERLCSLTISMLPNSTVMVGWWRQRRRPLRQWKGSTIRLGNKRRGFCLGSRPVVHWRVMRGSLKMLKKIIMGMAPNELLTEAYYRSLGPFLRPQLFLPLCWLPTAFRLGGVLLFYCLLFSVLVLFLFL